MMVFIHSIAINQTFNPLIFLKTYISIHLVYGVVEFMMMFFLKCVAWVLTGLNNRSWESDIGEKLREQREEGAKS